MKLVTVVKCILLTPSLTFIVHAKVSLTSSLISLWDLEDYLVLRKLDTEYMQWRFQLQLWALLCLEELPLMNKVHGLSALLLHCARANQLLSRNSNNGSDPFVHPHFQLLPGVPAFNTYILSVMPYTASYFGLSSTDLNYLCQQAVKFILGRHWIEAEIFPYILRYLGISVLLDFALSTTVAATVFTSGKKISMKIYGLNTVTAVGVIEAEGDCPWPPTIVVSIHPALRYSSFPHCSQEWSNGPLG